jgi:hypothetical protein
MIEITGLSQRQRAIADVLWLMSTKEQVESFVKALHPSMQAEAKTVVELMQWACFDEVDSTDLAKEVLDKFRI